MNTNQINNRKAEFVLAMKENNRDLYRAIAPAEMMALLHNCNPVHYEEGIDVILNNTDASEDMLMEYIDSNYCWEHDWNSALNTFLMDPVRAKLNKIKYEKGLLGDDELLAFALFLVGDSLLVLKTENGDDPDCCDTANLVTHVAQRLKFLTHCMNGERYDLLNTVIEYARHEMETPVDTAYCLDTVEPHDGGVLSYYNVMTDHKAFAQEHEKWKSAFRKKVESEQIKKCISGIKEKIKDALNFSDKKDEEPMVERDFEG